jgi:hypothetical protein
MTLYSSAILYQRVPMRDRRMPDIDVSIWASFVLIGLAIAAVALGMSPAPDPAIFVLS